MLPYVYKVTKYDPADWNDNGRYVGPMDEVSDHGPIEAAYLAAVTAFAADTGVTGLTIRDPELSGSVDFDYYDGAPVTLDAALTQRAYLAVWPDLSTDDELYPQLPALLAEPGGAMELSMYDGQPLITAVLPDADGVVRARWALL